MMEGGSEAIVFNQQQKKQAASHQRAGSQIMNNNGTFNSQRDRKSVGEGSNSTAEKGRSNTVLKERLNSEKISNIFQTPNLKGKSDKGLPLLGNYTTSIKDGQMPSIINKVFIHGKGATKLRKLANNALKDVRQHIYSTPHSQ